MSVIVKGKNPVKPYTVRYWVDGKQREKSFALLKGNTGAEAFKTKVDHDTRAQIFVDDKLGRENFGTATEAWLQRYPCKDRSRAALMSVWNVWVKPAFSNRSLSQVASDRDGVADLLTVKMRHMSIDRRRKARMIIVGVIDEAIKAGKLTKHHLADIELQDDGPTKKRSDFVFPTFEQHAQLVEACGLVVDLMRGCGVRIEEALAAERADFIQRGKVWRVARQASRDGREQLPLKHRKEGEYRDVPVPTWVWQKIKDLPDGPLIAGNGDRMYQAYQTVYERFMAAATDAAIPVGFTPHSERHAYASDLLGRGVPISDVAEWLGHRDINTTYAIYRHMVPSAVDRASDTLDAAYAEWSKPKEDEPAGWSEAA